MKENWLITGDELMAMLCLVAQGGDPDLVYAEAYANSQLDEAE